jgi:hypothetical protein
MSESSEKYYWIQRKIRNNPAGAKRDLAMKALKYVGAETLAHKDRSNIQAKDSTEFSTKNRSVFKAMGVDVGFVDSFAQEHNLNVDWGNIFLTPHRGNGYNCRTENIQIDVVEATKMQLPIEMVLLHEIFHANSLGSNSPLLVSKSGDEISLLGRRVGFGTIRNTGAKNGVFIEEGLAKIFEVSALNAFNQKNVSYIYSSNTGYEPAQRSLLLLDSVIPQYETIENGVTVKSGLVEMLMKGRQDVESMRKAIRMLESYNRGLYLLLRNHPGTDSFAICERQIQEIVDQKKSTISTKPDFEQVA